MNPTPTPSFDWHNEDRLDELKMLFNILFTSSPLPTTSGMISCTPSPSLMTSVMPQPLPTTSGTLSPLPTISGTYSLRPAVTHDICDASDITHNTRYVLNVTRDPLDLTHNIRDPLIITPTIRDAIQHHTQCMYCHPHGHLQHDILLPYVRRGNDPNPSSITNREKRGCYIFYLYICVDIVHLRNISAYTPSAWYHDAHTMYVSAVSHYRPTLRHLRWSAIYNLLKNKSNQLT